MGIDIIDWDSATAERRTRLLTRNQASSLLGDPELTASIQGLIDDVDRRGDRALMDALERFDGVSTSELRVSEAEFDTAADTVSPELSEAIDLAIGVLLTQIRGHGAARSDSGVDELDAHPRFCLAVAGQDRRPDRDRAP